MAQDIKSEVEKRLQQKQKSKDFKDIGRVDNTRKELAAYRLINIDNLDELEQDKVIAFNMVKKENVWKPYDIVQEKEKGVSSGAAYLKVKIRESLPAKPKDSEGYRKAYVTALTTIQNEFETCKTIDDIRNVTSAWYKLNPYNYTLKFVGGIPESITEEQFNKDYLNKNYYFRFTKIFDEQFGVRFYNTVYRSSDAGVAIWLDATKYDGINEELLVKAKESIQKNIENTENKYNKYINDFKDANDQTLRNLVKSTFSSNGFIVLSLKQQGVEEARQLALNYFEREKKQKLDKLNQSLSNLKLTDPDWSWGIKTVDEQDGKKGEVTVKVKARAINSKEPLAYIKRTGGYEITDISPKAIIENFGFGSVNYGNYVDDKWSKEHTKHFLGAMLDMGEILNIDIKKLTSLGNLKIAFGAKGRAGHLATYFPQTKDINLTKGNGDGSVAHEYGHYIDNVIMEGSERSSSSVFITETFKSKDYELNMLFRSLMDFIRKGSPDITPRVPFRFYAQKSLSKPGFTYGGRSAEYDIKDTIEETLKQQTLVNLAKSDANIQSLQKKVFGYVISQFGLDYYDIPLRLTTSYYFHKSAYNQFIYNYNNDKNEYVVSLDKRTKYWTSDVELFARAFETVVLKKFLDKNRVSNYLVDGIPLEDTVRENYHVPYPSGKELEKIESLIDDIIVRLKAFYGISDFKAPQSVRADEYIDLTPKGKDETAFVVKETPKGEVVEFKKEDETVKVVEVEEPKTEHWNIPLQEYLLLNSDYSKLRDKHTELQEKLKQAKEKDTEAFSKKSQGQISRSMNTGVFDKNERAVREKIDNLENEIDALKNTLRNEHQTIVITAYKNGKNVPDFNKKEYIPESQEYKISYIEKRIEGLKIALRFVGDKEFIEKRIKALEISLKVLSKKKFTINPKPEYVVLYGMVGTQLGNKFKLGIRKGNQNYFFDLLNNHVTSISKSTGEIPNNFREFKEGDYRSIEQNVNSNAKGVWSERAKEIKYAAENPNVIIENIEDQIRTVKKIEEEYNSAKEKKITVKIGDTLRSKNGIIKIVSIDNDNVYAKNQYGSEIYLGKNGDIVFYELITSEEHKNRLIQFVLQSISKGDYSADDGLSIIDEQGYELDYDTTDKLREAEKRYKKKQVGIEVGDTIFVRGKNGASDFVGNFRGFTNEGKAVVVFNKGNQIAVDKSDIELILDDNLKGVLSSSVIQDETDKYKRFITINRFDGDGWRTLRELTDSDLRFIKSKGFEFGGDNNKGLDSILRELLTNENSNKKFAGGGGVDYFPPKGELVNKSNHLLKYEKKGDEYVFNVYEPVKHNIDSYEQIRRVCKTKDCPLRMTYKQFIDYLYAETYIDDNKFAGGGGVETLINQGIVELNFYETTPEHAKQYGLKSKKPLFVQNLFVSKEERLKGVGKKVLNYLDEYAIKNGNDVIFGYVGQKSSFTKDSRQTTFSDIELIKYWLHENGYAINDDNNDFHKVVSKFAGGVAIGDKI